MVSCSLSDAPKTSITPRYVVLRYARKIRQVINWGWVNVCRLLAHEYGCMYLPANRMLSEATATRMLFFLLMPPCVSARNQKRQDGFNRATLFQNPCFQLVESIRAEDGRGQFVKGLEVVPATFVAELQPAEVAKPTER